MLLTEYLEKLARIIDEYAKTGYISSSELSVDIRAEHIGFIRASIAFIDGTTLFITEYLDLTYKIERLKYSYHFQDSSGNLLFRYDNARHKPPLGFAHHKHVRDRVFKSEIPDLSSVLYEIASNMTGDA